MSIFKDGRVLVSAPPRIKEKDVLKFVSDKAPWILKTLVANGHPYTANVDSHSAGLPSSQPHPVSFTPDLQDGASILYLGSPHLVRISKDSLPSARGQVQLKEDIFYINTTPKFSARTLLTRWFHTQAHDIFTEKTYYWSKALQLNPSSIHIRSQKTRWGSCSTKTRALHFNWKVLMAPDEILDYLVVHELCHLRVPNHSRDFWHLVGMILPDYQAHRKWLKQHGSDLNF